MLCSINNLFNRLAVVWYSWNLRYAWALSMWQLQDNLILFKVFKLKILYLKLSNIITDNKLSLNNSPILFLLIKFKSCYFGLWYPFYKHVILNKMKTNSNRLNLNIAFQLLFNLSFVSVYLLLINNFVDIFWYIGFWPNKNAHKELTLFLKVYLLPKIFFTAIESLGYNSFLIRCFLYNYKI